MAIQDLEKILQKDPVIHTFRPEELISNPEKVEDNYSLHAETHMPIGDTEEYYERLCNCLIKNKTTFVGAVVGDYGEGKTSLMIYYWHKCEADKIFAVPPYVWFNFQDNFTVIYSWTKYRVNRINKSLEAKLDGIYGRYRDPSLEKLAEDHARITGGKYDATLSLYKRQFERGELRIELSEDNLLSFCSEISSLVSELGYRGFLVFNDELEFTVEAPGNSLNKVAGTLFKLGDSLINSQGNYGFFFGMARNFQSQIHAARSAVLDRIAKQRVFMRLSEVYGQDFPRKLWENYVEYFELGDIDKEVVAPETLEAIGQVCDSSRRDLGNGPRSVISAFNRMIFIYNNHKRQYSPLDFAEDCLNNEITLGTESNYARLIKELLADGKVRDTHESALKLLAAYPRGCSQQTIAKYKLYDEVESLIKSTGFGKVVFDSGSGYALVKLQLEDVPQESIADAMMQGFYNRYSASKEDLEYAINAFRDMIIPQIFTRQQKQSIEGWIWSPNWREERDVYSVEMKGTFPLTKQYPERSVAITIISDINRSIPDKFVSENVEFSFIFDLSASANTADISNSIQCLTSNKDDVSKIGFSINLLCGKHPVRLQLGSIPENEKTTTPLFPLALLGYMADKELPQNEQGHYNHVRDRLLRNLLFSIFSEDMLKVESLEMDLDNRGERLIPELFLSLCKRRFPNYSTLICQTQWAGKITSYVNVLRREDIPLSVKRGSEPWQPSKNARDSRQMMASGFNISAANLETWLTGLESLVDSSRLSDGVLTFRIHPLEELILSKLERCPVEKRREVKVDGKECQWVDATEIMQEVMTLGYTVEELSLIIGKIAGARYSLRSKNHYFPEEGGDFDIIYRLPVSIPELRENLKEKVHSLEGEYEYLEAVRGFEKRHDLDKILRDIGALSDEEDYERIKHNLHGCFQINHRWTSRKIEDLKDDLTLALNGIEKQLKQIQSSGYETELKKRVAGQARWIATFRELIQENLRKDLEDVKTDLSKLEKAKQVLVNKYSLDDVAIAREGAQKLYEFQNEVEGFLEQVADMERQIKNSSVFMGHYRQWLQLIKRSDEVYDEALKIKTSPLYREESYWIKHLTISEEIEKHLGQYNIQGLSASEEYLTELEELGRECRDFYGRFRESFILTKELLISFLKGIVASTNVIRESFNPDEPKASYDKLYDEVHDSVTSAISEMSDDLSDIRRDVDYLFSVLAKGPESDQSLIREKIIKTQSDIVELETKLNRVWLENVVSAVDIPQWSLDKSLPDPMDEIIKEVSKIRENLRLIHKGYYGLLEPDVADEVEITVLNHIKGSAESNLKEIILLHVGDDEDKSSKLDEMLEILKRLFKKNLIEIKVRKTQQSGH